MENEELKKALKRHEPELGKAWFTAKKESKAKLAKDEELRMNIARRTLQPSNNGLESDGLAINYYGDLSPFARKLTGFDGLNRRVQNEIKKYHYYQEPKKDLYGYISMMYLSIVLG